MPVSVSCMAVPMRPAARAARLSTQRMARGRTLATRASTISMVSMPVTPNTPGARAQTLRMRSSAKPGNCSNMWARDQRAVNGLRAERVRRDASIAQPDHQNGRFSFPGQHARHFLAEQIGHGQTRVEVALANGGDIPASCRRPRPCPRRVRLPLFPTTTSVRLTPHLLPVVHMGRPACPPPPCPKDSIARSVRNLPHRKHPVCCGFWH